MDRIGAPQIYAFAMWYHYAPQADPESCTWPVIPELDICRPARAVSLPETGVLGYRHSQRWKYKAIAARSGRPKIPLLQACVEM